MGLENFPKPGKMFLSRMRPEQGVIQIVGQVWLGYFLHGISYESAVDRRGLFQSKRELSELIQPKWRDKGSVLTRVLIDLKGEISICTVKAGIHLFSS